jgi:hypothetical protein
VLPPPVEEELDAARLEQDARRAINAWAHAWSDGRADDLVAAYSEDYRPWGVGDRALWEGIKRLQLERDAPIEIELGELRITPVAGGTVSAEFDLDIQTARYAERLHQTLLLVREAGAWKIIEERAAVR